MPLANPPVHLVLKKRQVKRGKKMKRRKNETKQNWKQAVKQDTERREQHKKRKKREEYSRIYNKLKKVEFKTGDQLNMDKLFFMPKMKEDFTFGGSLNALAVYPVLCSQADFREEKSFQMSRENIAKLAGISTVCVDKGLSVLEGIYLSCNGLKTAFLEREKVQDGKRRYWTYLPGFFRPDIEGIDINKWRGHYFVFHTCIIGSGVWASLSRKAKALYVAIRSVSWFDQRIYLAIEDVYVRDVTEMFREGDNTDLDMYRNRKWEVCDTTLKHLFELARIPYHNTKEIVNELEKNGLVERLHDTKSVFQVWLRPNNLKSVKN